MQYKCERCSHKLLLCNYIVCMSRVSTGGQALCGPHQLMEIKIEGEGSAPPKARRGKRRVGAAAAAAASASTPRAQPPTSQVRRWNSSFCWYYEAKQRVRCSAAWLRVKLGLFVMCADQLLCCRGLLGFSLFPQRGFGVEPVPLLGYPRCDRCPEHESRRWCCARSSKRKSSKLSTKR